MDDVDNKKVAKFTACFSDVTDHQGIGALLCRALTGASLSCLSKDLHVHDVTLSVITLWTEEGGSWHPYLRMRKEVPVEVM